MERRSREQHPGIDADAWGEFGPEGLLEDMLPVVPEAELEAQDDEGPQASPAKRRRTGAGKSSSQ